MKVDSAEKRPVWLLPYMYIQDQQARSRSVVDFVQTIKRSYSEPPNSHPLRMVIGIRFRDQFRNLHLLAFRLELKSSSRNPPPNPP